jgi:hypothetical protein
MDYLATQLDSGTRWLWLFEKLEEAAKRKEVFGGVPERTVVVPSAATISAFVNHFLTARAGVTSIVYGLSGAGKTMAAMYLMQAKTPSCHYDSNRR